MKRREFSLSLLVGSGAIAGLLAGCKQTTTTGPAPAGSSTAGAEAVPAPGAISSANAAPAQQAATGSFVAGQDYMVLKSPLPTEVPKGKAEVVEFFGYWCPHCNHFEPEFEAWRKSAPAELVVNLVPVAFRPEMVPLQRMYYALVASGKLAQMHGKVFDAVHKERQQLFSDGAVLAWAAKQPELQGTNFAEAYKSFAMDANLRRANQLVQDYGVEGVPSFGVAGKYYIDGEHAQGMTRALQIVTQLGKQEAGHA